MVRAVPNCSRHGEAGAVAPDHQWRRVLRMWKGTARAGGGALWRGRSLGREISHQQGQGRTRTAVPTTEVRLGLEQTTLGAPLPSWGCYQGTGHRYFEIKILWALVSLYSCLFLPYCFCSLEKFRIKGKKYTCEGFTW